VRTAATDDHANLLRHEHVTICELLDREHDRVGIREQRVATA
jgi:hypothetical protein